jgi:hypothetical protein
MGKSLIDLLGLYSNGISKVVIDYVDEYSKIRQVFYFDAHK